MKIKHIEPYVDLRRDAYMSISDQMDVLYKLAKYLGSQGFVLPVEVSDWIESCDYVKDKFKKN